MNLFLEFAYENVMWGCMKSYNKVKTEYVFNCPLFKEILSILIHNENYNDLLQECT